MATIKMSKQQKLQEQKWQAQDDARTMAAYQELMQDKARMNRAIKEAKNQAKELEKRTNIMKKAANQKK